MNAQKNTITPVPLGGPMDNANVVVNVKAATTDPQAPFPCQQSTTEPLTTYRVISVKTDFNGTAFEVVNHKNGKTNNVVPFYLAYSMQIGLIEVSNMEVSQRPDGSIDINVYLWHPENS
jgi:hypothetical protein